MGRLWTLALFCVVLASCTTARPSGTSPAPSAIAEPAPAIATQPGTPTATPRPTDTDKPDQYDDGATPSTARPTRVVSDDVALAAMARRWVDAIDLPKLFPYRVQLYDPAGPYHASFGGFDGDTAILLVGRADVRSNVVVHEYGHAWHEKFMKYDKTLWAEYGKLRGFTDPMQVGQGGDYLQDWRERFAFDFQWAFNPDYNGAFAPTVGYWDPGTLQRFREFVRSLPARPAS